MRMLTWNVLNRTIMEPFDCWSFLLLPQCSRAPTMGLGPDLTLSRYVGGEVAPGKPLSWRLGLGLCSWIDLVDMCMFLLGGCFPFTCVWQCCYIEMITLTIVTFAEWCWCPCNPWYVKYLVFWICNRNPILVRQELDSQQFWQILIMFFS